MVEHRPSAGWLEVHAENYMNEGALSEALADLRRDYAVSVHGVGLSLGSAAGLDPRHLARLKVLVARFEPAFVSEHVSWSVGDGIYLNDLLPIPYDDEALAVVARNVERVQEALGREILLENLSHYVGFAHATMSEPEFLSALVRRTGCGLLLDVNNVHVSAVNMGFDADAYIARLPGGAIREIHLAGHHVARGGEHPFLIDDHGSHVSPEVWHLYRDTIARFGPRPTLIEWDSRLPSLEVLLAEADRVEVMAGAALSRRAGDAGLRLAL
jgi:hypothetical protein